MWDQLWDHSKGKWWEQVGIRWRSLRQRSFTYACIPSAHCIVACLISFIYTVISPNGTIVLPWMSKETRKEIKNIFKKKGKNEKHSCQTIAPLPRLHFTVSLVTSTESVKKSCEGTWLDDAVQLWTTGVNVGRQVKKAEGWGSFICCQSKYRLRWRNVYSGAQFRRFY